MYTCFCCCADDDDEGDGDDDDDAATAAANIGGCGGSNFNPPCSGYEKARLRFAFAFTVVSTWPTRDFLAAMSSPPWDSDCMIEHSISLRFCVVSSRLKSVQHSERDVEQVCAAALLHPYLLGFEFQIVRGGDMLCRFECAQFCG